MNLLKCLIPIIGIYYYTKIKFDPITERVIALYQWLFILSGFMYMLAKLVKLGILK